MLAVVRAGSTGARAAGRAEAAHGKDSAGSADARAARKAEAARTAAGAEARGTGKSEAAHSHGKNAGGAKKEVIELEQVRKSYMMGTYKLEVLKGIDLRLNDDDFVAIMGPSGSGKSTLLHILGLLDIPTTGSVRIGGQEINRLSEDELARLRGEKIGFVFQFFYLISTLSAMENVQLPMLFEGVGQEEREQRAAELLERVGLGDRKWHKPGEMSGGERQRVAIARALANRPSMLLADEPTGNLDSKSGAEIMELFKELHEQERIAVIMVTHDPAIAKYAHKIIKIRDGSIEKIEKN
ncbi:MAG: ABC transporter ATP-binding protein [Candidatus Burarchaeum sp.]|nr:ABC transporter ATP-binding protein [Candidatus Burarchaeum sp.]MDO8339171.1 ABC transporter ATP-binding protein [Candidatus Burarchaeum sp.]